MHLKSRHRDPHRFFLIPALLEVKTNASWVSSAEALQKQVMAHFLKTQIPFYPHYIYSIL